MRTLISLPLIKKLSLLFFVAIFGFLMLSYVSFYNLNIMKKNLDITYFGNLVPIVKLENIYKIYSSDILNSIYQAKLSIITPEAKDKKIEELLKSSLQLWREYMEIYKDNFETNVLEFANNEILSINRHLISDVDLEKKLNYLKFIVNNLIEYEIFIAQNERLIVNDAYKKTISQLTYLFVSLSMFAVLIYLPLMRNIYKTQKNLENTNISLKNLSITDSLTGLYNRRHFNYMMNRELNRAVKGNYLLTFIILDIDFFKKYNDTYGHQQGDEAIKSVANVLKSNTKESCNTFRIGGEEFAIILRASFEDSKIFIDNLLEQIRALKMEHKVSDKGKITISIGAINIQPFDSLIEESIIKIADDNLYKAKDLGRDRAVFTKVE